MNGQDTKAGATRRILVVDDEKNIRVALGDFLTSRDYKVDTAASGKEALDKLPRFDPHLIILDMAMPGMSGVGFLKRIVSDDGKPSHPVLVLTARANMREFFDGLEVNGFLPKPCGWDDVEAQINRILAETLPAEKAQEHGPRKVLVGDCAPERARYLATALGGGYDVEIALTGPDALEMAASLVPDVILLHTILPNMNGSAVADVLALMSTMSAAAIFVFDGETGVVREVSTSRNRSTGEAGAKPNAIVSGVLSALDRAMKQAQFTHATAHRT